VARRIRDGSPRRKAANPQATGTARGKRSWAPSSPVQAKEGARALVLSGRLGHLRHRRPSVRDRGGRCGFRLVAGRNSDRRRTTRGLDPRLNLASLLAYPHRRPRWRLRLRGRPDNLRAVRPGRGPLLGIASRYHELRFDGIGAQALLATLCVYLAVYLLYALRIVKVTSRFATVVVAATGVCAALSGSVAAVSTWGGSPLPLRSHTVGDRDRRLDRHIPPFKPLALALPHSPFRRFLDVV